MSSYERSPHREQVLLVGWKERDGTPGRIRTCDMRLRRPPFYPLNYGGIALHHARHDSTAGDAKAANRVAFVDIPTRMTTATDGPACSSLRGIDCLAEIRSEGGGAYLPPDMLCRLGGRRHILLVTTLRDIHRASASCAREEAVELQLTSESRCTNDRCGEVSPLSGDSPALPGAAVTRRPTIRAPGGVPGDSPDTPDVPLAHLRTAR